MPFQTESHYPLISVVMATYNGAAYVEEQLTSILQQTYPSIEIVIVDDASQDDTVSIIKKYAADHSSIKLFVNAVNSGYIKAFEKGLQMASGEFIALSDQDDIWMPAKISTLYEEIGSHPIVYSDSLLIDEDGNSLNLKLSDRKRLVGFDDCLCYTIGNSAAGHAMLITKELAKSCIPFPSILPHDYWIGFRATCKGPIKYIPEPLVQYRQHAANVFGVARSGTKTKRVRPTGKIKHQMIRDRIKLLQESCPSNIPQKQVLQNIERSYENFSLSNNLRRVALFFRYRDKILAYKNRSEWRKWLFCLKIFVTIQ
ncbi:MAG TPA: glycosyltransferase family 2 protein [Chitinophagaceae bacterium]|nr:glycosyltransferase family 2 protein [Chitinophagaceae bacterium]